jgi:hypothetical protein
METQQAASATLMNDLRAQVADFGLQLAVRIKDGGLIESRARSLCRQQTWVFAATFRLSVTELAELRQLAHETAGLEE